MRPAKKTYGELETFNMNWDNYTIEERGILLKNFKKTFFELNDKPLEL